MAQRSNPALFKTRIRKQSSEAALLNGKKAQRIPSWPGVFTPVKAEYICADQLVTFTFRLRQDGGPYIFACDKTADHTFRITFEDGRLLFHNSGIALFTQKPGRQHRHVTRKCRYRQRRPSDAQFGPPANTETTEPGEVDSVSRPTMTVYSPQGKNTGTLAIDLEGTEVCDWLTSRGNTFVLLKYRVPYLRPHWDGDANGYRSPSV